MTTENIKLDKLSPFVQFIRKSTFGSFLLFFSAGLALILANSPANVHIQWFLNQKIGFTISGFTLEKSLLLWINDGLMSIFFFVVGLELKREILAGELSVPKNVLMPIIGALGGMILPALIYVTFNISGSDEALKGWGIPMATDIAFALGVLYLLGPKVPIQLKVFLTALAIIDDLGAVLVVAIFYTSEISTQNLLIAGLILGFMFLLSKLGVRRVLIFSILGIGGVWLATLLSGVHATIAAVVVAFVIPADRRINKARYIESINALTEKFKKAKKSKKDEYLLSSEEENIIGEIKRISKASISPMQRLERSMHGLVAYLVMPIFALANAGVIIDNNWLEMISSPVALGVGIGLVLGKILGIYGLSTLGLKLGWFSMPDGLNNSMLLGISFLAAIGFTMSLFINSLAFTSNTYLEQAKMGVLLASFLSGTLGYLILKKSLKS
ncbi:Na+/H+ antiporter NhaA [Belliella kenyensis]|uniref:Na(+)/H(+) antiporter NhaA n=1 Tax=Belliella kenyensis TaxID=1472724 RepID=A0ABV8EHG4_9BACT|nr:Na+/H+ antiporter NhaA [Belliella kenyensis]MCH7403464.1 Na+/H+ antiporter NhaA [Belliella kenyensis]MDN3602364.1 Na+/H+ antiporter NhaA [Belliella kenyensis]